MRLLRITFWLAACLFSPLCFAHHPTSSFGLTAAAPQSMVELETRWVRYPTELDGLGGQYASSLLRLEYAFTERLSLAASLPFAVIWPKGNASVLGLGDPEVAVKWSIIRPKTGFGHLSIGTGVEFPVGDETTGIGSGHFELSPFLSYQSPAVRHHVVVYGRLNALTSVGGHHTHSHGAKVSDHIHPILAPHSELEMQTMVGVAWLERAVYGSVSMDYFQPLDSHSDRSSLVQVSAELGILALASWRFALAWDQPVTQNRRIESRVRLGIAYWFD